MKRSALQEEGVDLSHWDKRNRRRILPDIASCVAFASIEEKDLFQKRVHAWAEVEADLGKVEGGEAKSDGDPLCP